jgi:hypothetical protein
MKLSFFMTPELY